MYFYFFWIALIVIPILIIIFSKDPDESPLVPLKYPPIYNGKNTSPVLGTINGIGIALCGKYRIDPNNYSTVQYQFIVFAMIPLIPLGCYRVSEKGSRSPNFKSKTTYYNIYGTEKWRLSEIWDIYKIGIIGICLFVGIAGLISQIYTDLTQK